MSDEDHGTRGGEWYSRAWRTYGDPFTARALAAEQKFADVHESHVPPEIFLLERGLHRWQDAMLAGREVRSGWRIFWTNKASAERQVWSRLNFGELEATGARGDRGAPIEAIFARAWFDLRPDAELDNVVRAENVVYYYVRVSPAVAERLPANRASVMIWYAELTRDSAEPPLEANDITAFALKFSRPNGWRVLLREVRKARWGAAIRRSPRSLG
jgi:hypothetical protein